MPLVTSVKTVAATATLLASPAHGSLDDAIPVLVWNDAVSAIIYLGGATVTSVTGIPLAAQTSTSVALVTGDDLYGITSSGTASARVMVGRS